MKNGGLYISTQGYPNAIHTRQRYPEILLRPGQIYRHRVVYKFGLHMVVKKPNPKCEEIYESEGSSHEDLPLPEYSCSLKCLNRDDPYCCAGKEVCCHTLNRGDKRNVEEIDDTYCNKLLNNKT